MTEAKQQVATGILECMAGLVRFCLPNGNVVQAIGYPLRVVRLGGRTFFFKPDARLTYFASPTVLNPPSRTVLGRGFGIFKGDSLEKILEDRVVYTLNSRGTFVAAPTPSAIIQSHLEIRIETESGQRLRLEAQEGFSFEEHALIALYIGQVGNTEVVWNQAGTDVSTAFGANVEELRGWYDAYTKN